MTVVWTVSQTFTDCFGPNLVEWRKYMYAGSWWRSVKWRIKLKLQKIAVEGKAMELTQMYICWKFPRFFHVVIVQLILISMPFLILVSAVVVPLVGCSGWCQAEHTYLELQSSRSHTISLALTLIRSFNWLCLFVYIFITWNILPNHCQHIGQQLQRKDGHDHAQVETSDWRYSVPEKLQVRLRDGVDGAKNRKLSI